MIRIFSFFIIILTMPAVAQRGFEFIPNQGQWEEAVLYKSNVPNGALFLEQNALNFHFYDYSALLQYHGKPTEGVDPQSIVLKHHVYRMNFLGSTDWSTIIPNQARSYYYNFYKGQDPSRWKSRVSAYEQVSYQNIYPKVDFSIYTHKGTLKYDFIVQPGGDLSQIRVKYEGIDDVSIKNNELYVKTSIQQTIEEQPIAYQMIQGQKREYVCRYVLKGNVLSFAIEGDYDRTKPLVIDPTFVFGTYSGSLADNFGMTATYDEAGHLYSGGTVFDIGFHTTPGAFQTTFGGTAGSGLTDVIVSKYELDGSDMIYSTYMGGTGTESVNSMIANSNNELYIYGATSSNNFPTLAGSYDLTFSGGSSVFFTSNGLNFVGGTDIYVTKFNPTGTGLLGSTYMGGSANDCINSNTNPNLYDSLMFNYGDQSRGEVMLDDLGNCYIASSTQSSDFPMVSSYDNTFNGKQDAVVFKLNSNLTSLLWSTYLGGSQKDAGFSIKVDNTYNAYVCGGTSSSNFPTTAGVLNTSYQGGKTDGYVAKISSTGSSLLSSTYIGTSSYDQTFFVEIDDNTDVYLLGQSQGNMPVVNVAYSNPGSKQFVQKLNNTFTSIVYSSVFGDGTANIKLSPAAFLVDQCQNVYVSGWGGNILTGVSMTTMPTTPGSYSPNSPNGFDFYLTVFERDFASLTYATYFGGTQSEEHVDGGTSRFDKKGIVYQSVCAGCGSNSDFPTTPGAFSSTNNSSNCNNGVFKFDFEAVVNALFASSDTQTCTSVSVFITNQSTGAHSYYWNFGNGTTTTTPNDTTIVYNTPGTYTILLVATDTICNISDTVIKTIQVFPNVVPDPIPDMSVCAGDSITYVIHSNGTANIFIWSSNSSFSDTLNPDISDSSYTIYVLGSQTYYVQIGNGPCSIIDTVHIDLNQINATVSNTPSACGFCTGTATVIISGGGYTYQWNDPLAQTSATATGLCVGNYQVTIADSNGCTRVLTTPISDTSALTALATDTIPNLCYGNCNASMTVTPSGGTAPYTYLWNDPAAQTDSIADNLCAGNYEVTVTDVNGCETIYPITISQPGVLTLSNALQTNVACHDDCTGSVALTVIGGTTVYTYQWNDPASQTTATLSNVCAGTYSVTVTDANNCSFDSVFVITQPSPMVASFASSPPLCFNICNGTILATVSGGAEPYDYQWNTGQVFHEDSLADHLCSGTYHITIRDSNNCIVRDTIVIADNDFTSFPVHLWADKDTLVQYESTVLHAEPTEAEVFIWSPAGSLNDASSLNPIATPLQTTTYTFTVIDDQNPECRFDSTITIYVLDYICADPSVFVPNAFTPNGDGNNDILYLRGRNLTDLYFTIYNRWGEKVFETSDINKGWNGLYKGVQADPGVFDYYLDATCPSHEKVFIKGNVTLIR